MTSATRLAKAFAREFADRIPLVEFCTDTRCAETVLGRPTPIHNVPLWLDRLAAGEWESILQQEATDRVDLAREAGYDFISVDQNWAPPADLPIKQGPHQWRWRGRVISYDPKTRLVSDPGPKERPLSTEELARRILTADGPSPADIDDRTFELVRRVVARRDELGLEIPVAMRTHGGMTVNEYLELLALFPDAARRHFQIEAARAIAWGTKAAALGVTILTAGGHVGANQTSMISPDHFRQFILPPMRDQIQAGQRAGAKVCVASGGCIGPFADAFLLESGADGYWGIDTYAGMDLVRLRERYGGKICLVGGVDSVLTLTQKPAAAVREETLRSLDLFRDCPGFMLASSNSLHDDVRPENFLAMIRAYRDFHGL